MRTSNPAFSDRVYSQLAHVQGSQAMTIQGTVNKTAILLTLLLIAASWTWHSFLGGANVMPWLMGALIAGLIVAIVTAFKKEWSPITSPVYALLEGVVLGGLSVVFEQMYPGIVIQAVMLTGGVFIAMLLAYKTHMIRATEKFQMGVFAATAGIGVVYLLTWILSMFGVMMPMVHGNGLMSIGFSIFVVIIAALNLVMDFEFIHQGAQRGAPRYMEWYGAFGLMVTLVWLYIEILRLLAKLNSRR